MMLAPVAFSPGAWGQTLITPKLTVPAKLDDRHGRSLAQLPPQGNLQVVRVASYLTVSVSCVDHVKLDLPY